MAAVPMRNELLVQLMRAAGRRNGTAQKTPISLPEQTQSQESCAESGQKILTLSGRFHRYAAPASASNCSVPPQNRVSAAAPPRIPPALRRAGEVAQASSPSCCAPRQTPAGAAPPSHSAPLLPRI